MTYTCPVTGFPKAPVWWYRSWWLANISQTDAGRPPLPNTSVFVRIVESWQVRAFFCRHFSTPYAVSLTLLPPGVGAGVGA